MPKKVYHAHVETEEGYYDVTTYNVWKNQIETRSMTTGAAVRRYLHALYEANPKRFTSNWSF